MAGFLHQALHRILIHWSDRIKFPNYKNNLSEAPGKLSQWL